MSLRSIATRLLGAYCPDDMEQREAHTDSVVRRAAEAKRRAEGTSRKALVDSYRACDERLRR